MRIRENFGHWAGLGDRAFSRDRVGPIPSATSVEMGPLGESTAMDSSGTEHGRDAARSEPSQEAQLAQPGGRRSGDDILRALDDFSTGLDNLKVLYAQRQELRDRVEAREAELGERDRLLAQQQSVLEAARQTIIGREDELARTDAELKAKADQLTTAREELAALRREAEERSAALERAEVEARARDVTFGQLEAELVEREQNLAAAIAQREAGLSQHAVDIELRSEELSQLAAEIERGRAEIDTRKVGIEQRAKEIEAASAARSGELDGRAKGLEAASREHERLVREARDKSLKAGQECAQRAKDLAEQGSVLAEGEAQLAAEREALERTVQVVTAKGDELAAREAELARMAAELAADRAASELVRGNMDELTERIEALSEVVAEYEALWLCELGEGAQQRGEMVAAEAVIAQLRDHLGLQLRTVDELRQRMEAQRAEQSRLLDERDSRIGALEASAASTGQDATQIGMQTIALTRAAGEIASLRSRVENLQEELAQAQATMASCASGDSGGLNGSPSRAPLEGDALSRRRRRLKAAHDLLRKQTNKLRKGSEVLRKRFEACESLLAQRAELASIRDRVVEAERRAQRSRAGSRSAVTALCAVVVLGLLAGLSWAMAVQFAPATFEATATLRAEGRGRELNAAELAEWGRFHFDLLKDPRFHAEAAEKFKRQGLVELATPAAVAKLAESGVLADSDEVGQLRLIHRDRGADRAARTLEVFAASLQAHANDAQTRRIDGGVTVVSEPARSGSSPIDQTRPFYALGIMGASTFIIVLFSAFLWRKLAKAKTDFEKDEHTASVLDEARWPNPLKG